MILYHTTTEKNAKAILTDGFKDGEGTYLTLSLHKGVWLSDTPLDAGDGAPGNFILQVELNVPETDLDQYEWKNPRAVYREWLIPAAYIADHATLSVFQEWPDDDQDDFLAACREMQETNWSSA